MRLALPGSEPDSTVSCQGTANATLSKIEDAQIFMKWQAQDIVKNVSLLLIIQPISWWGYTEVIIKTGFVHRHIM